MTQKELDEKHQALKKFLQEWDYLKPGRSIGPVQDVPISSNNYKELGLRILIPLPFRADNDEANTIMAKIKSWATEHGLERFGYVWQGEVPLLIIGLKESTTDSLLTS